MKVTFEVSKLAKEKGFMYRPASPAFEYYKPNGEPIEPNQYTKEFAKFCYPICEQSALQHWLREEYRIHVDVNFYDSSNTYNPKYQVTVASYPNYKINDDFIKAEFEVYEEALECGLLEGLKLIKIES